MKISGCFDNHLVSVGVELTIKLPKTSAISEAKVES